MKSNADNYFTIVLISLDLFVKSIDDNRAVERERVKGRHYLLTNTAVNDLLLLQSICLYRYRV